MSAPRGGALRRTGVIALASAKDLFAGHGAALVVLALIGIALAVGDVRAVSDVERRALALRRHVDLVGALAAAAAVLAAAHVVDEARRSQRFARFATTPLTAFEALAGKTLGVALGIAAVAVPVELALLLLPGGGLVQQREQFAPRQLVAPSAVELVNSEGQRFLWRRGPALLERGATLTLRFDLERPAGHSLELPFARASDEPLQEPLEWTLGVQDETLITMKGRSEGVVSTPLARVERGPVVATVRVLSSEGVLRIDPAGCRLRGPPGAIASSVARAAAGLVTLLLVASALAAGLAVALPDVLAAAGAGGLLVLAALRSLFVDVADALADPHAHVGEATRVVAAALGRLLAWLPDLARATASGPLSRGAEPWAGEDARALLLALLYAAAAWLLGAAWLRRTSGNAA